MLEFLNDYVSTLKKIYGVTLRKVILFGSYARGDFNEESDIDIAILIDLNEMDVQNKDLELSFCTYDFNQIHNSDVQPISINYSQYVRWLKVHPFYKNIMCEGVTLYEQ